MFAPGRENHGNEFPSPGAAAVPSHFTLGQAALMLGVEEKDLRYLARLGSLAWLPRCGRAYVVAQADLPRIRDLLAGRGVVVTKAAGGAD
jgi:hypothetical protein